jgi:hypothetical protein
MLLELPETIGGVAGQDEPLGRCPDECRIMKASRYGLLIHLAIFLGAAVYFAQGATLTFEWADEGPIVYPSWRVAEGEVPYRDFQHIYGPSLFTFHGALFRVFGPDLLVVRLSLAALKAVIVLLTYALSCRVACRPFAVLVSVGLIAIWGSPIWVFHTPYANYYAFAAALAALLVLRPGNGRRPRSCLLAGLLLGIGATFKQTTGLFGFLGVLLFLALDTEENTDGRDQFPLLGRFVRVGAVAATVAVVLLYVLKTPMTWSTAAIAAPVLASTVALGLPDRPGNGRRRAVEMVACALGMIVPLIAWVTVYALLEALPALVHDTILGLPQRIAWLVALPQPRASTLATGAAFLAGLATLCFERRRRLPAAIVLAIIAVSAAGLALIAFDPGVGWLARDLRILLWLPFVVTYGSAVSLWRAQSTGGPSDPGQRALRLYYWYAALMLLTLYPSADVPHAVMILPAFLPLLAHHADRLCGPGEVAPRRRMLAGLLLALALAAVAGPFIRGLVAVRMDPRSAGVVLKRASRLSAPSPRLRQTARVVEYLDATMPPGAPAVILPQEQITYFLAGRRSVFQAEEFVLYLVAFGLIADADARALVSEKAMIGRLERNRPAIVRYERGRALGRFRRVFVDLDAFIAAHYRPAKRVGDYLILEWSG